MAVAPRTGQDQVERKVAQLHTSGLSVTHLRLGAQAVLAQSLPLRDAPVLREARRFAAMQTPELREAIAQAGSRLREAVPDSTFAIWFAPLRAVGASGSTVLLIAPDGIRTWVERRYLNLIREALQATGSGYTDVEFVSVGEGS